MNAEDYYNKAIEHEINGNIILAGINILSSIDLLEVSPFAEYKKIDEINEYSEEILTKINNEFSFPIKIEVQGSLIEVFAISIESTSDGIFPKILYSTEFELDDGTQIEEEARIIHPIVCEYFKIPSDEFKYYYYSAHSELPQDSETEYIYYNTLIEGE